MSTNTKPNRWFLVLSHVGIIVFMMSCAIFGSVEQNLDDGDIVAMAGVSFEMVGELENTDPWVVAGQELETNEYTQIEDGLEVGVLVKVRGIILEDETWVVYSIESTDEQTDSIIVFLGVVDSVDPWSVNGISLNVTDETDIQGDVTAGTIVRVEILILEDGTWEVISITSLEEATDNSGCVTVVATIVSIEGDEIQFLGWPTTVTLNVNSENTQGDEQGEENEEENDTGDENESAEFQLDLEAGQTISAVVCVSEDGQLILVQIVILDNDNETTSDDSGNGEKVLICHKPDKKGGHTLSIASPAVPAHLAHGDYLGACP